METVGLSSHPQYEMILIESDNDLEVFKNGIKLIQKECYNWEISQLDKNYPKPIKKAYEATKEWLKDMIFNKNTFNYFNNSTRNISEKYLKLVMLYQKTTDHETELLERTSD